MYKSKEIDVDIEQNRYKRYFRFLGIPFNEGWKTLPKIQQVAVTRISVANTLNSPFPGLAGSGMKFKDERYFVFMVASKTKKIEIFRSEDLRKALEVAMPIAMYIGVKMIDYTKLS